MNRRAEIEKMLEEDPKDPFLIYALALEDGKDGKLNDAVTKIELLLLDQPDYLGAYYQLGQWYEQMDEGEKAKRIYGHGILLAKKLGNKKTEGELRTALENLE